MSRVVVALAALTRGLGAVPELTRRLEHVGILPVGKDQDGQLWVDVEARQKLERVKSLLGAGYAPKDIALVIGKVERAAERPKVDEVCDVAALAAAAKVAREVVTAWATDGLLPVWARREDGEPLFLAATAELAKVLAAADLLDLGAHKAVLARIAADRGQPFGGDGRGELAIAHSAMRERLDRVEQALRVLKKPLALIEASSRPAPKKRLLARRKKNTTRVGVPRTKT